jgi:hypothetical protein
MLGPGGASASGGGGGVSGTSRGAGSANRRGTEGGEGGNGGAGRVRCHLKVMTIEGAGTDCTEYRSSLYGPPSY